MKKIIFLFALLNMCLANAQWQTDTAINLQASNTVSSDIKSVTTDAGGTYIVYMKSVLAPVNFEVWVQYLDPSGTKVFGDNGMLVTNTLPMSTYTTLWKITTDHKNDLYISMTGTGTGTPAYVYKVSPNGTMPWGAGINVGEGYTPTVLPLDNTDVLISWLPADGTKAKIQRYNAAGVALWTNPIIVSSNATYATNSTVVADMYEQSNGYFTAVFHTRLGMGVNSYLFAQRYDSNGTAQWTQPTQLADKGSFYNNLSYTGALDGDVLYYGYSLANGTRYDTYAQRINTDGTLPWGINGVDFDTNMTSYEINGKLAYSPGSQYIWMIADYTPSSQSSHGEYVQKFDKVTGARQFTDNAHQVYAVSSNNTHTGNLYLVNDRPLFALKTGFDNGATPVTLSAQFLDVNGNFTPSVYVKPLATFAGNKSRITLNKPVNNQGVITFVEQKVTDQSNIYAQNFSTILDCQITTSPVASFTQACSVDFEDLTAPTGTDSCGGTITATTPQDIFPITANTTITWTFTSVSGVSVTQTQEIIIANAMTPAAMPNITAACSAELTDLTVPVVADSCGNNVTGTTDESLFPITQNTTITWTFTSVSGTTAIQTQNIIITSALTPPATLADVNFECAVSLADLTIPVVNNECGNPVTPTTDAEFPLTQGPNTITWTYAYGDTTATVTQNVIVNDTTAPVLAVQNVTATIAEDGTVTVTAAQFDNGSTDACTGSNGVSSWTWTVTPDSFTCDQLGEQTVTITVTDLNGNESTSTATVTITDPNNYCIAGVDEFNRNNITMYPNPTQDILNISSPDTINSIVVYDMLGKMVFRTTVSANNATIDAKAWSTGVYNVAVESANGGQQKLKLVKN